MERGSEIEVELLPENFEDDLPPNMTPTAVMSQVIQAANPTDSIVPAELQQRMAQS